MPQLPTAFTDTMRRLLGDGRFERYLASFDVQPPVSIRLHPLKILGGGAACPPLAVADTQAAGVPWCREGWYLSSRPAFTMDPLLHAGCYYVQEAASMFLAHALASVLPRFESFAADSSLTCLDLCAAPGGKSTLLRSLWPSACVLYSNEPVRQRASVLAENVAKWGYSNHVVTSCYPSDYRQSGLMFDLILCDVPCSGEGMFRKDAATIDEWSPQQVERCAQLQRNIVSDAWACLQPGGVLVYSTCTFNTRENEETIRWLLAQQADAEVVPVSIRPEWGITGSLLAGFTEPVYRFIPGLTLSEGLFVCILHKSGRRPSVRPAGKSRRQPQALTDILTARLPYPVPTGEVTVELTYPQAMAYLRRESLTLPPDVPRGVVGVTFLGRLLGYVKNIGQRANNLYPKEWRIKTTHTPATYTPILTPIV